MNLDRRERDMHRIIGLGLAVVACAGLLASCGSSSPTSPGSVAPSPPSQTSVSPPSRTEAPISPEKPVPVESNPPGDIPDSTQFVPFRTNGGFKVSVPEGWARTKASGSVSWTDKLNTVVVDWATGPKPTVASAKHDDVKTLARRTRAFHLVSVTAARLPAGQSVLIEYQANSDPNSVTGKQYRLDVLR